MGKLLDVAIFATGDEIIQGDVLESNGQFIASRLNDTHIRIGNHLVSSDNIDDLEASLRFLLARHQVVITMGGLGPTSDDITRIAVSNVIQQPLVFHQASWQRIQHTVKKFHRKVHSSNKQQAYFPEKAILFANPFGSADGCLIKHGKQQIYMLPGPPAECLPMVEKHVIPRLQKQFSRHHIYKKTWLLFGVSEGAIASDLDKAATKQTSRHGYCFQYPYIEFKLWCQSKTAMQTLSRHINKVVKPYLIDTKKPNAKASECLLETLLNTTTPISICDQATGGLLQTRCMIPSTHNKIFFISHNRTDDYSEKHFLITGLEAYWKNKKRVKNTTLTIQYTQKRKTKTSTFTVPYRGERTLLFAVEFISQQLYYLLK